MIAHAGRANFSFLRLWTGYLGHFFAVLEARTVSLLATALLTTGLMAIDLPWSLTLLRGSLVHQVQDPEVVLGVLEIPLGHHAITAARRIAAQLQIFLKELLGCAADPDIRAIAIENMIPIERDAAPGMVAYSAPATSTATTAARAMVAATHAFHVHTVAVVLSRCGAE